MTPRTMKYSAGEDDTLYDSIRELMEHILHDRNGAGRDDQEIPETVRVFTHEPPQLKFHPEFLLETVLTQLDGNFGDPNEGTMTRPTRAMRDAAQQFCQIMSREYVPWGLRKSEQPFTVMTGEYTALEDRENCETVKSRE